MAHYRLSQIGHLPLGETWTSTLHIDHIGDDGATLLTACLEAVTLLWQGPPTPANSIQQLVPTTIGCDELVLDELNALGKNVAQNRSPLSLDGTSATDMLPHEVSVAYTKRTFLPTRAGRGRGYLPPFSLDTCVGGILDATAQAQVVRACKGMLDHINLTASIGCVVYHRGHNSGDYILSVDVGDVFDSQRRRRGQITETRISAALA